MSELCLVLNLGSSSFKAALVDPTGAFPWQKSRSLESSDNLEQVPLWPPFEAGAASTPPWDSLHWKGW